MDRWKLITIGQYLLLMLACSVATTIPAVNVERAVELTVTALVENADRDDEIQATTVSRPAIPTAIENSALPLSVTTVIGCELPGSGFEIGMVTRVIDGDTIEANIGGEKQRIRYIGIDAPEAGEPGGTRATEENRRWVADQIALLVPDTTDLDRYGRLLRYVYLEDGTFVNEELVKSGCARSSPYPPDLRCQDILDAAELRAPESGCEPDITPTASLLPPPPASPAVVSFDSGCSQFDAPGNDNENKNEEFVCFSNLGSQPATLTGWTLRDSYGWTYIFPEFTLEVSGRVIVRTGCGENTEADLFWCKDETAVWNNDGDCVYLIDSEGEQVVAYCY